MTMGPPRGVLEDTAMAFVCPTAIFHSLLEAWPGSTGVLGILENCLDDVCKDLFPGLPRLLKVREL